MAARSQGVTQRRILVVDDNFDQANLLAVLLRSSGHDVHVARDGHGALEAAHRLRPEFLFLDLSLPKMDGYQVARLLRADPALSSMRIIAITGHALEEDRERSRDAGIDVHLVKPVDPRFLESLLGPRPLR